jgi:hypothetical protein
MLKLELFDPFNKRIERNFIPISDSLCYEKLKYASEIYNAKYIVWEGTNFDGGYYRGSDYIKNVGVRNIQKTLFCVMFLYSDVEQENLVVRIKIKQDFNSRDKLR